MALLVSVVSYNGAAPTEPRTLRVSDRECVIGRHPDCDLSLSDPECTVSRRHARIAPSNGGYVLTDTSTSGTYLNGAEDPIATRQETRLHDGDTLGIGPYELSVRVDTGLGACAVDPFGTFASSVLPEAESRGTVPDIMDLLDSVGSEGVHGNGENLLGSSGFEPPRPSVENMHFPSLDVSPETHDVPSEEQDGAAAIIGRDGAAQVGGKTATAGSTEDKYPSNLDDAPGIPEGYDVLRDELVSVTANPSTDPDERSPGHVFSAPHGPPVTDSRAAGSPDARGPVAASAVRRGEGDRPSNDEGPETDAAALPIEVTAELAAFFEGLGVDPPVAVKDSRELLRVSGELLRALTAGLMSVMAARASFKSELRLEITTIRARDNNPFQFCVDPDDALERLLWRRSPGYLEPATAASKTCADIQAHEMAIVSGLRGALKALLEGLDPHGLEERVDKASQINRLLPVSRKSHCWDLFVETYAQIAEDASDDFMRLFGGAFNRAYEEQIRRLDRARNDTSDGS